jgi:SAM-dependent methyltransferase
MQMNSTEVAPRYDSIGVGYARVRREDPELRARIIVALGSARTVVNVGAGAGSYEPRHCHVTAIEPSSVMASQRAPDLAPAILATADRLPLCDRSADAAMSVLSLHHWDAAQERGVRELRRVARGPVVIVTYDARICSQMWLMVEYLPEVAALDTQTFPHPERIAEWLGGDVTVEALPISRDTPDWTLGSYWAHPERVLDPEARRATSGFARMPADVVERAVAAVGRDLADGVWDSRHADLRALERLDVGMRLIVGR